MAKPGDNAGNDFSVAMLTDQHVRPGSAVPEGNHQLLGMPKCQNNGSRFPIQRIHRLITALLHPHRSPDRTDDHGSEGRQQ